MFFKGCMTFSRQINDIDIPEEYSYFVVHFWRDRIRVTFSKFYGVVLLLKLLGSRLFKSSPFHGQKFTSLYLYMKLFRLPMIEIFCNLT